MTQPTRFWAEMRGDTLLLYPMAELLKVFHMKISSLSPSVFPGCSRDMLTLEAVENTSEETLTELAGLIAHCHVIMFVFSVTTVVPRRDDWQIALRSVRSFTSTLITLESFTEYYRWRRVFLEAQLEESPKYLSDFDVKRFLGSGASGDVFLLEDKETNESLAVKVIEKKNVYESNYTFQHALDERLALQMLRRHPYVLEMRYAFQNARRLFLVTEFCGGGDMYELMDRRQAPLPESKARLAAAQIILALQHIHSQGFVYRDMKLENVLIDDKGNIRIADFGLSKLLKMQNGSLRRTMSFVGTQEYIAPEMFGSERYGQSVDFWTLGVLVYEVLVGQTPYEGGDNDRMYEQIFCGGPIYYPDTLSDWAEDFLRKLLVTDPNLRLGVESFDELKGHAWFDGINWEELAETPPETGPFYEYSRRMRVFRETMDTVSSREGYSSIDRSQREQKQARALHRLENDITEDEKYVAVLRHLVYSESAYAASRRRKPYSPLARNANEVVAGYGYSE